MSVNQEILVTGIKVVDLLAPYAKGGKIGKIVMWFRVYNITFSLFQWIASYCVEDEKFRDKYVELSVKCIQLAICIIN